MHRGWGGGGGGGGGGRRRNSFQFRSGPDFSSATFEKSPFINTMGWNRDIKRQEKTRRGKKRKKRISWGKHGVNLY